MGFGRLRTAHLPAPGSPTLSAESSVSSMFMQTLPWVLSSVEQRSLFPFLSFVVCVSVVCVWGGSLPVCGGQRINMDVDTWLFF